MFTPTTERGLELLEAARVQAQMTDNPYFRAWVGFVEDGISAGLPVPEAGLRLLIAGRV